MTPAVRVAAALALSAATSLDAVAQDSRGRIERNEPTEIVGFVRMNGCVPDPEAIDLRARPISIVLATSARDGRVDERTTDVRARFTATPDPHVLAFSIRGLQPVTQYHLAASVPPSPVCGKAFWRSATGGFAVSGGDPVVIEAVTVSTSLEIQQHGDDLWVGADDVDFLDAAAGSRRLRWRSFVPGAIGGELQISTAAYPTRGEFGACDEPAGGVFHRQSVPAPGEGEWAEVEPIPLARILGGSGPDPDDPDAGGMDQTKFRLLLAGAPLYARVIPVTADGPACDIANQGVAGWVVMSRVPRPLLTLPNVTGSAVLSAADDQLYSPPYFWQSQYHDNRLIPDYEEFGFRVIKPRTTPSFAACDPMTNFKLKQAGFDIALLPAYSDAFVCQMVRAGELPGGVTVPVGFAFAYRMSFSVSSGGFGFAPLDQVFVPFVTGLAGAGGVGVNAFADLYNGAVDAMKDVAYEFLQAFPPTQELCNAHPGKCEQAINIGMTYGMMAMGLPPSVPNWDQLKQEGVEYLAHQVADSLEEQTGVPSPLTEAVLLKVTQEVIDQMTANRGGDNPATNWFTRFEGLDYPYFSVAMWRSLGAPPPVPVVLQVQETALYRGADVGIPRSFPPSPLPGIVSQFLRVPVILRPNLAGIPAPLCRSSFYTQPHRICTPLPSFVSTTPMCQWQSNTGPESPWKTDAGCERLGDMVSLYYRDYWKSQRLDPVPCTTVAAATLGQVGVIDVGFVEAPIYDAVPGLTFVVAASVNPRHAALWDPPFASFCP